MFSSRDVVMTEDCSHQQHVHAFSKKFLSSSKVIRSGSRPIRRASYSAPKQTHLSESFSHTNSSGLVRFSSSQQILEPSFSIMLCDSRLPFHLWAVSPQHLAASSSFGSPSGLPSITSLNMSLCRRTWPADFYFLDFYWASYDSTFFKELKNI